MMTLETKNKTADQFVYSHLPMLEEISAPLRSFGITHFSYNKFIGKDKIILLCPQIISLRERFGHSLDQDYIVQPQLDLIHQNTKFLLWQNFPPHNPILETLQEFNINHGITLFRKIEEDICESFHFATTNDNEQMAGSKMKCNTVECLLKKQTKNGVANGIIRTIKIRGKGENGAALAIEGFDYTDCISVGSV